MTPVDRIWLALYKLLLYLYPAPFRDEFGAEMAAVFAQQLSGCQRPGARWRLAGRELAGLLSTAGRERVALLRQEAALWAATDARGAFTVAVFEGGRPASQLAGFLGLLFLCFVCAFGVSWVESQTPPFGRPARVHEVALGDLTGDGRLDAYLNIGTGGHVPYVRDDYLLFNEGNGRFRAEQFPGQWPGRGVTLADLTGNGLADILLNIDGGGLVYYTTHGQELFQLTNAPYGFLSGTGPGTTFFSQMKPTVGDLNGDGQLDIFGAGCCGHPREFRPDGGSAYLPPYSLVWLNDGRGNLLGAQRTAQQLPSQAAALADLNSDGSLDVFLANGNLLDADVKRHPNVPNAVWFNDAQGNFSDSGQQLGEAESVAVALGDLTGNGFPDAVVGNNGRDEIWLNDGQGFFSLSDQQLGSGSTRYLFLADFNGSDHLDIFIGESRRGQVWFNNGEGGFTAAVQTIGYGRYDAIALGDVTGNGHLDIFVAGVRSYRIFEGRGDGRFSARWPVRYR